MHLKHVLVAKIFVVNLLVLLFLLMSASTPLDKSKLLVGRWTLVDFKTPSLENNFKASKLSPERRKTLMQDYVAGSYIEFRADGTYEVSILGSDPEVKYWQLNEDDTRLIVRKLPDLPADEIELETLTKKELVMVITPKSAEYVQLFFVNVSNE